MGSERQRRTFKQTATFDPWHLLLTLSVVGGTFLCVMVLMLASLYIAKDLAPPPRRYENYPCGDEGKPSMESARDNFPSNPLSEHGRVGRVRATSSF